MNDIKRPKMDAIFYHASVLLLSLVCAFPAGPVRRRGAELVRVNNRVACAEKPPPRCLKKR